MSKQKQKKGTALYILHNNNKAQDHTEKNWHMILKNLTKEMNHDFRICKTSYQEEENELKRDVLKSGFITLSWTEKK